MNNLLLDFLKKRGYEFCYKDDKAFLAYPNQVSARLLQEYAELYHNEKQKEPFFTGGNIIDPNKKQVDQELLERIFFNKDLTDAVRTLVKESAITLNSAISLLIKSKNLVLDSIVIKNLINTGASYKIVEKIINELNQ